MTTGESNGAKEAGEVAGVFDSTGECIQELARRAGFNLEPTPNMLYTVRGNHAQLVNFARLVLARSAGGKVEAPSSLHNPDNVEGRLAWLEAQRNAGVRVLGEAQPLTDAEILCISGNVQGGMRSNPVIEFARAVEQSHGIGNAGVRCAPTMTDEQAWSLREHLPTSHDTTGKQFFGAFARAVLAHVSGVSHPDGKTFCGDTPMTPEKT